MAGPLTCARNPWHARELGAILLDHYCNTPQARPPSTWAPTQWPPWRMEYTSKNGPAFDDCMPQPLGRNVMAKLDTMPCASFDGERETCLAPPSAPHFPGALHARAPVFLDMHPAKKLTRMHPAIVL